jgi:ABC-type branched-subunit amino acid transport system ATPase component
VARRDPELDSLVRVWVQPWRTRKEFRRLQTEAIDLLSQCGLEAHAEKRPLELSGGQIRLATLVCALFSRARVLLLDEPLAGLDPSWSSAVARLIADAVNREERLVVFVEHNPEFVTKTARRVLAISQGRLLADGEPSVLVADRRLAALYDLA